jgi:hypothetical protein
MQNILGMYGLLMRNSTVGSEPHRQPADNTTGRVDSAEKLGGRRYAPFRSDGDLGGFFVVRSRLRVRWASYQAQRQAGGQLPSFANVIRL